jgi:hypothetical protein
VAWLVLFKFEGDVDRFDNFRKGLKKYGKEDFAVMKQLLSLENK